MRKVLTAAVLFLLVSSGSVLAEKSVLWENGIALIPHPQSVEVTGDSLALGRRITVALEGNVTAADRFAADDLVQRLVAEYGARAQVGERGRGPAIVLERVKDAALGEQAYRLTVDSDGITVQAAGEAGLFYGTRTLLQLLKRHGSSLYVNHLKISDKPDIRKRAAHYDTKHHQDKYEYVQSFIRDLADYKINMLLWEWEDKFEYPSHPVIGAPGAFTKEEMQALTAYARKYHVQIVPLVQGLGHVSFTLKWPEFAHLREIPASNWEYCPLKEGSYELLFELWKDAAEATPGSKYLHIGCDETYELGLGVECGCQAEMEKLGKDGLFQKFINRCSEYVLKMGRTPLSWGGGFNPESGLKPPRGHVVGGRNPGHAAAARAAGYETYVYDPNPGIEHLFLPYFHSESPYYEGSCLERSREPVAAAARSGGYDVMINTSWDDSGLHNQVWMMSWINSAEWSWNGGGPGLEEFIDKFFVSYYGKGSLEMRELWTLLNYGAFFYMDAFERKVWHWGDVGKTHLPDLPRWDAIEYDPFWTREYAQMIGRSRHQYGQMQKAVAICKANMVQENVRHLYDFEVFLSIAELIAHTAKVYIDLAALEDAVTEAHRARFVSHEAALDGLEKAGGIVKGILAERGEVYGNLVAVWEKTRLPKGMDTPEKKFFFQQDRARHFGFRRPDMSYLICDEQMLGLEDYLAKLTEYTAWYRETYL
ncbi:MAG: family 20 glycosylhydrolase [Candidatus Glassbacteria bacterium]|nr:family 20 glycosylhydrolase [Candidatus Glassbacteria bacterium]